MEIPFRRYSSADGLPSDLVTALAQSRDGLLWIGTAAGLGTYDGERFYPVTFPDSIGQVQVSEIVAAADSSVWVNVWNHGVVQLRAGRNLGWREELVGKDLVRLIRRDGRLHAVIEAPPDAAAWWRLAPGDGRRAETHRLHFPDSVPKDMSRSMTDAAIAPDGRRWVVTRHGPAWIDEAHRLRFVETPAVEHFGWDAWLRFLSSGEAFLRNRERVYWFDPATSALRPFFQSSQLGVPYENASVLYLPGDGGVRRWHVREQRWLPPLDTRLGLPVSSANCVLRDREGGLWVGTKEGLVHLYEPDVRHLRRLDGVDLRNANSFTIDAEGALWANAYTSGVVRLTPQPDLFTPLSETRGILLESRPGALHYNSVPNDVLLRRRPGGRWEQFAPRADAFDGFVDSTDGGVFYHNDGVFLHDFRQPTAPVPLVKWPYDDRKYHAFTYAPESGLFVRARNRLLHAPPVTERNGGGSWQLATLMTLDGFAEAVTSKVWMTFDAEHRQLWLSLTNGLVRLDLRGAQPTEHHLLPGLQVEQATLAGDSLLLAPARGGLYLLDAEDGRTRRRLTEADGLLSSFTVEAVVHRDTLYVAHPNGVSRLPWPVLHRSFAPPTARITAVERAGETTPVYAVPAFRAEDRTAGFSFASLHFAHPERVRYEYRLLPGNDTWRASERAFAEFTNLRPGRHRFEVRARLEDEPPGPAAAYVFRVPPFFYETTWFRLLCLMGVVALAAGLYRLRMRHLKRREQDLEALVAARTRDLAAEKEKTEAQAQRLRDLDQAKSRFFANISHAFRTPLTLILGPTESALDGRYGALPDSLTTALRRIRRQARRLLHLVEQLLDLSRLEHDKLTLQPHRQDLVGFLRARVRAFMPLAERQQLHLVFRAEAEQLSVSFDPGQLEKVIANLVSNALKFTPAGGKVFVIVRRRDLAEERWAEIAVRDTGPGIARDDLERIFDRFEQVDGTTTRRHEGTGIGLAVAKELTELHGGTLLVESEPGFGSTFFVRLPLSDEAEASTPGLLKPVASSVESEDGIFGSIEAVSEACPPSNGQSPFYAPPADDGESDRPLVLVVEDHAEVRAHLREQLAPYYRVLEAEDGADGLAVARAERPDLVLADVMMPGTDGIALLDALKADEQLRAIPVMLLTARAAEVDRVEGLERGADDYLVKPFSMKELLARVERLIQTRRALQARYRKELKVEPADVVVESEEEAFLRQVLEAAEAHLGEPRFGAEALAETVGLSRRQLTRKLKALLDEPPSDLLRRLRLERAAQLLDAQHGRVSEIAYAVGFKSPSHFTRAFRTHFGCTPSDYSGERVS